MPSESTNRSGHRLALAIILAFACAIRLLYVLKAYHEPLVWDQLEYTKLAVQLLEKGVYAYRDTVPNTLVTPGFPLLLTAIFAIFGYEPLEPALTAVRVLQCFLCLPGIGFLYLIGARLFKSSVGLLAAMFAAVYPAYVWSTGLILTEVPFLSCLLAMVYMQVRLIQENRSRDHLWHGLLLGITVLIRPNVLPMAIVPYVFLWFSPERRSVIPNAMRGAAIFAMAMLPWWTRNLLTFHRFIFMADGEAGNPFLGGTDPYFQDTIDWSAIDEKHQFAEGLRRIREGISDQPLLWLQWLTIGKLSYFFRTLWVGPYPSYVPEWYYYLLNKLHFYVVYIGGAVLACRFTWSRPIAYLTLSFGLFCGVHMAFIPVDRYAYGMLPFLMLGSAYAAIAVMSWTFELGRQLSLRALRVIRTKRV